MRKVLYPVLVLLVTGCAVSQQGYSLQKWISLCRIAEGSALIEADIVAWGSPTNMKLPGYGPNMQFAPLSFAHSRVVSGMTVAPSSALIRFWVQDDGTSVNGPLKVGGSPVHAYVFLYPAGDQWVVSSQGIFRFDGTVLRNSGLFRDAGISRDVFETMAAQAASGSCDESTGMPIPQPAADAAAPTSGSDGGSVAPDPDAGS